MKMNAPLIIAGNRIIFKANRNNGEKLIGAVQLLSDFLDTKQ